MNTRVIAAKILVNILQNGLSFTIAVNKVALPQHDNDRRLVQEICYGILRHYFILEFITQQLLKKPFKQKDFDLQLLIYIGLYQIIYLKIPDHAAVNEVVNATKVLKKHWASKLINAVLRNFIRQRDDYIQLADKDEFAKYSHPQWMLQQIKTAWPTHWQQIVTANNQHAPMSLRINLSKISRADYGALLTKADINYENHALIESAVVLSQGIDVNKLPGFTDGLISVQDVAAQLAAYLIDLQPEQHVLDACAAPGGKAAHMLEHQAKLNSLLAIDNNAARCEKIDETFKRLQLQGDILCADANKLAQQLKEKLFDRILLDAPCSATGVIRRHPDIKFLRRASDIKMLTETQLQLLTGLWPLLNAGGKLLYATCSILPEENQQVISRFLQMQTDARELDLTIACGHVMEHGRQILPGEDDMDGFYYCLLGKV